MLPTRRPRLMAQRHADEACAQQTAEEQQVREHEAKRHAEALARDRARTRRTNTPLARTLVTAGGWILSILGALAVSLALTYLVNHPKVLDSLGGALRSFLRVP